MSAWLTLCGGFLIAVLWMDLMFDVQALRDRGDAALSEPALASIAGYYRRVTSEARPMNQLIGAVMLGTLLGAAIEVLRGDARLFWRIAACLVGATPIALAQRRVFPNAVRLGARCDPPEEQSRLARAIARDHVVCLVAMLAFVAIQLAA